LIEAQKKKAAKEKSSKTSRGQAILNVSGESSAKYCCESRKWQELTDSVAYCIAKDMMPIYAVEKEGFKTLLGCFDSKHKFPAENISPKLLYLCCMQRQEKL